MRNDDRPIPLEIDAPTAASSQPTDERPPVARGTSALAALDEELAAQPRLVVRQRKDWGEVVTGWEKANRYDVHDASGALLFHATEVNTGALAVLLRLLMRARRPFRMEVIRANGTPVATLVRPWRWWLSDLEVVGADGRALGRVEQQLSFVRRVYRVADHQDRTVLVIVGPLFRPWTFLLEQAGQEVGSIQKKWRGLGIETFTDADTYLLEWSAARLRPGTRALTLFATILIDFVHFEWRGS